MKVQETIETGSRSQFEGRKWFRLHNYYGKRPKEVPSNESENRSFADCLRELININDQNSRRL